MMDFLIIGAGRSGTTTLFNHLKQNPDIFIPPQKEVPIGDMDLYEYMDTYFQGNIGYWGTITPQYMADPEYAPKLYKYWPGAKIIAILRHPVERARSHHQQASRRGNEPQSFEQCFRPGRKYWDRSLYGEILKPYFDLFGEVLVVYTEDLKNDPEELLKKISARIGVKYYEPNGLGKYYNVGRSKPSIFQVIQKQLKRVAGKNLIPPHIRQRVWFWLEMARSTGAAKTKTEDRIPDAFVVDAELIKKLTGRYPPWLLT